MAATSGGAFLIEAMTLALLGSFVGALLGAAGAVAIAWEAGWPILISPVGHHPGLWIGVVGISFASIRPIGRRGSMGNEVTA